MKIPSFIFLKIFIGKKIKIIQLIDLDRDTHMASIGCHSCIMHGVLGLMLKAHVKMWPCRAESRLFLLTQIAFE